MKKCNCPRWEHDMDDLGIMMRSQIQCKGGYKGEAFVYCPWCGKELITVKPKEIKSENKD